MRLTLLRLGLAGCLAVWPALAGAEFGAASVKAAALRDVDLMRSCYELFLAENEALEGQFTVAFSIAPEGHVTAAVVETSTLRHSELEGCVLAVVRAWTFPAPGETVVVQYPFVFKPAPAMTAPTEAAVAPTATAVATAPATAPPLPEVATADAASPLTKMAASLPRRDQPSPYFILSTIAAMFAGLLVLLWLLKGKPGPTA